MIPKDGLVEYGPGGGGTEEGETEEGDTEDVENEGTEHTAQSEFRRLLTRQENGTPMEECNNVFSLKRRPKRLSTDSENISDEARISLFPVADLNRLEQMISWPRWIIPVLPEGHLEVLLRASIDLAARGLDTKCEPCQRFIREGLTISFTRILTDEAVTGWKFGIHKCIFQNCERLLELIVIKLKDDCFPILDLLAMVFNPNNKFHMFNMIRLESLASSSNQSHGDEKVYAQSPDSRCPRGWLVDLINYFGRLDGFQKLMERFEKGPPLTVPLIAALLKPFGQCYEFLTVETMMNYFLSIIESVPVFLESLSDEELKKESKNEGKNDVLSGVVKSLKNLASRVPNQEERIRELEIFRLKIILRLLQISSFNGKMNALNEVNKVIASVATNSFIRLGNKPEGETNEAIANNTCDILPTDVAPYPAASTVAPSTSAACDASSSTEGQLNLVEEEDWLTATRMAQWIRENRVLQIVLKDSLHQPQYVEKLEKIIRFVIKEKALTLQDLDDLWAAQSGKHEAIVKNMHDLLAKLAWDFTPEQLDHLFECFRSSWTKANKKQREKLLELIRRLAEDDKDGVMANKVLNLFWNLAHSEDIPTDIMDQALAAHVKILDYSCCQDRDSQKTEWLDKCVEELKKEDSDWVLPALKLIREICCLLPEAPSNFSAPDTQSNLLWAPVGKPTYQSTGCGTTTPTPTTTTVLSLSSPATTLTSITATVTVSATSTVTSDSPTPSISIITPVNRTSNSQMTDETTMAAPVDPFENIAPRSKKYHESPKIPMLSFSGSTQPLSESMHPVKTPVTLSTLASPSTKTPLVTSSISNSAASITSPLTLPSTSKATTTTVLSLSSSAIPSTSNTVTVSATSTSTVTSDSPTPSISIITPVNRNVNSQMTEETTTTTTAPIDPFENIEPRSKKFYESPKIPRLSFSGPIQPLSESIHPVKTPVTLSTLASPSTTTPLVTSISNSTASITSSLTLASTSKATITSTSSTISQSSVEVSAAPRRHYHLHKRPLKLTDEIKQYAADDFFRQREFIPSYGPTFLSNTKKYRQETTSTIETHGGVVYRHDVISRLHSQHSLVVLVSENLSKYMKKTRQLVAEKGNDYNAQTISEGKRYSHTQEVIERLNFLRFLLKDGRVWLCAPQAKQVWQCLAENAIFHEDREACFRWFSILMLSAEEQDLDPEITRDFFEDNILQLDPILITESGIECFNRFFKAVNHKEGKFIAKKHCILTQDLELIGLDYLWRIVLNCSDEVANWGIALLKETYTNLGPSLEQHQVNIHHDLLSSCMDRLQAAYDTVSVLRKDESAGARVEYELSRMSRVLRLLYEYVHQCDTDFGDERTILPLVKAVRGEQVSLTVRFPNQARHIEDIQIWTHRNEYISTIKKQILSMIKANNMNMKVDLFLCDENAENDANREDKLITELPDLDEVVLNAKLYQASLNAPTSPDSSSDSSSGSPGNNFEGPSLEAENSLPGVIMSKEHKYVNFFLQLLDLGMSLGHESLCDTAPLILTTIPPDVTIVENLKTLCKNCVENVNDTDFGAKFDELFYGSSPTRILYSLGVIYALIMPSRNPLSEEARKFHYDFMKSGCGFRVVELLTRNNFVSTAVDYAKILVFSTVLRISGLVLTCLGHYLILSSSSPSSWLQSTLPNITTLKSVDDYLATLRSALEIIPHPLSAGMVREIAIQTAQKLVDNDDEVFRSRVISSLPDLVSVRSLMMLCWATATGDESALRSDVETVHQLIVTGHLYRLDCPVYTACKLSLNILTLMLMISPWNLDQLIRDNIWRRFVIDVLLVCGERSIRLTANEQFALIATKCALSNEVLINFIRLLHHHLGTTVSVNGVYDTSEEFFHLFCKLLNNARSIRCPLPQAQQFLESEIELLSNVKQNLVRNEVIEETLLEGHLGITRELIYLLKTVAKNEVNDLIRVSDDLTSQKQSGKKDLIRVLIDEYVFTASRAMVQLRRVSQPSQQQSQSSQSQSQPQLQLQLLPQSAQSQSQSQTQTQSQLQTQSQQQQPQPSSSDSMKNSIITVAPSPPSSSSSAPEPSTFDQSNLNIDEVNPICTTSATLNAAYDCLVALGTDCIPNLKYLVDNLIEMYYSDNEQHLTEWEYQPPIGPRPARGFVGLKNAGATCYMNSVFQQLYMIPEVRGGILSVEGAVNDLNEDFSEDRMDNIISTMCFSSVTEDDSKRSVDESRRDYNLGVLKYTQAIFGHLALSKLQYYVPRGFWRHFKLWGEPVNLREQHDALEFFNSLVDSLDEALKSLGCSPVMTKILGGSFADQKICKECPHRYSREEPFTPLNIDIRNHSNLLDSLEQYVKGDLLEGANAYHCEKCNRKVETVKRLCIKKLPTVLAIQLKRFDYDFERSCAIKFNDYFEFPRILDMEPYTVNGLAKIEGEIIEEDLEDSTVPGFSSCTQYELCGIVVHSGQASGGHYYSYILHKNVDGFLKWYKFDDGDVSECKLDDDEEMKVQCFGGDYMGEVFDHMLKRMSCRRQKRWWNAYILFYRRMDTQETELLSEVAQRLNDLAFIEDGSYQNKIKMPTAIEKSVQRQNIKFMHTKNQFSPEYFQFMKKLLNGNGQIVISQFQRNEPYPGDSETEDVQSGILKIEAEEIAMICTQLASRFLFMTCFHAKKNLRGSAVDWSELLNLHLRASPTVRAWFAHNVLFSNHYRFCEYLLDCPNNDVRSSFAKIIIFLAHFALCDNECQVPIFTYSENSIVDAGTGLSDCLLQSVLSLLNKEVSEHSRHLTQYFNLFYSYATIGSEERAQLLRLNVPSTFMRVALDEGPGPPIKYQYADFAKLYQVVSLLIRCCDVSSKCVPYHNDKSQLPNPFGLEEENAYLMPIQPQVYEYLYKRTIYVKKIIEDVNASEDTLQLLRFCSWENPAFSFNVLNELLWQIEYTYAYELRPHLDLIFHMLMITDSWQEARINNALSGLQDEREGLFDTIQRNKSHYQKRAYQCIKCLVSLFSNCPLALKLLHYTPELKKKWVTAINWLNEELERRPYAAINQYSYNWSPPAQSNDTSNGYYLERSNSAKLTLSKAYEICPPEEKDEIEEQEVSEKNSCIHPYVEDCT